MSLSRNASFSLVSAVLQMAVTIVTIPIYLRVIGLDRYGVIVVVWLLFDYMMLFSLGLDKAASNYLAKVRESVTDTGSVFGTAAMFSLVFGLAGGVVMLWALYPVMQSWMGVSPAMASEAGSSARWIAALVPLAVTGLVFTSFLQSRERFFELSAAQLLTSVAFQVVPLTMALFLGANLEILLVAGAAARAVMPVAAIILAFR
ncbi:MAG TPA: hypothetical protein VL133_16490, partial [Devosia sp.]|nr:hypothetical protein [Devosia sp.]